MTIKEFCEKYDCDLSGIYKKIKRKNNELNEHIVKVGKTLIIDEYAEKILKPGENQRKTKQLIDRGKSAAWDIERAEGKANIEWMYRQEAEEQYANLKIKYDEVRETLNVISAERDALLLQLSELNKRIEELERKPKGIFGRK